MLPLLLTVCGAGKQAGDPVLEEVPRLDLRMGAPLTVSQLGQSPQGSQQNQRVLQGEG